MSSFWRKPNTFGEHVSKPYMFQRTRSETRTRNYLGLSQIPLPKLGYTGKVFTAWLPRDLNPHAPKDTGT